MAAQKTKVTSQEFQNFINLPENEDLFFERINGEIIEVSPSFGYSSGVAFRIAVEVGIYLKANNIAFATGEGGGYEIDSEHTFAPDVAVILKSRLSMLPENQFIPIPPDFAIEVVSASDLKHKKRRIEKKLETYLLIKIPLLWYTFPDTREVKVYAYGEYIRTAGINDVLDGGDVLPGFILPVKDIFPG